MITPLTLDDVENASDEEIIAAYMRDGETEDRARAFLWQLRDADPRFPD
ncbi:hypothetical protein [Agromyces albus]|nr:hypothetical protein [Agromyces albus]MDQ0573842.1 hypothetical protein [Agromyces albus]